MHLVNALKSEYKCTLDLTGSLYCGVTLDWDYEHCHVDASMPGYVDGALHKFQHPKPHRPEHSPHDWTEPTYGAKQPQLSPVLDTSPLLDSEQKTRIQQIVGTFLFYARAVNATMLVALGSISSQQSAPTETTRTAVNCFLGYAATHPNAVLRYSASDMVLHIHSDASYLSEAKARSRSAGHHFLSSMPTDPTRQLQASDPSPPDNGAVFTHCNIMKNVVGSAAESNLGALYENGKEACFIITALTEMGHPQPPVHMMTDNSTATGISNKTVKQCRSKAINMRYYWLQDRVEQGMFKIFWHKGADNQADYFTKHHSVRHHRDMRPRYLRTNRQVNFILSQIARAVQARVC